MLDLFALLVDDYDPAISWFVDVLDFELAEDSPARTTDGREKRWVVVRPRSSDGSGADDSGSGTGLLLARADGERQVARIGDQFAGRVGLFLRVPRFADALARLRDHGVELVREPRREPYGEVAVFRDPWGNRWDLLGPRPGSRPGLSTTPAPAPGLPPGTTLRGADIYLVDLVLRDRLRPGSRVLDVGCGSGRNLPPLLAMGCAVTALDPDPGALAATSERCSGAGSRLRLLHGSAEELPLEDDEGFDLVLVNAVLHFAPDRSSWIRQADGCWASVAPGGRMFARLSTRIALPAGIHPPGFGYLATEDDLLEREEAWGAQRSEPLKTTLVERLRTMTTWVLARRADRR